jgi:hypothetical protein
MSTWCHSLFLEDCTFVQFLQIKNCIFVQFFLEKRQTVTDTAKDAAVKRLMMNVYIRYLHLNHNKINHWICQTMGMGLF